MIRIGNEVILLDEKGEKKAEVVVIDLTIRKAYVEHESGDCEWVERHQLREM